jgi:hypothetical protein
VAIAAHRNKRFNKEESNLDPTKELVPIDFANVNDGAMTEGFGIELQKALANIADINTPATATRVVTLQLILKPHSDRTVIETEFKCSSKLADIETHKSKIYMGATEDGSPIAFDADPRQMILFTPPKPKEAPQPLAFRQD